MKIILSSKTLAINLSKIDFNNDEVTHVEHKNHVLTITTNTQEIDIPAPMVDTFNMPFNKQYNRRWDWVYKLVLQCDEQPIVLEINENTVNVIFQY